MTAMTAAIASTIRRIASPMRRGILEKLRYVPGLRRRIFSIKDIEGGMSPESIGTIVAQESSSHVFCPTHDPEGLCFTEHSTPPELRYPPAVIVDVRDARVVTRAGISLVNRQWLLWTTRGATVWRNRENFSRRFSPAWLRPRVTIAGPALCFSHPSPQNYYHTLVDLVSQLVICKRLGHMPKTVVTFGTLPRWQREMLSLFIAPEHIVSIAGEANLQMEHLWMVSPPAIKLDKKEGETLWYYRPDILEATISHIRTELRIDLSKNPTRRLFVTRRNASRLLENEHELAPLLEKYGFETVDPGALSFKEQVMLFSSASAVLGIHGAGLANILFAPETAKICEIGTQSWQSACYAYLTLVRGQSYHRIMGSAVRGRGFTVDIDAVRSWMQSNVLADAKAT